MADADIEADVIFGDENRGAFACDADAFDSEWREEEDIPRLKRVFNFENFTQALAFSNKVGALAEEESHHPAILTEWGKVTVQWWTHKIKGLHRNDLIMAAKTDQIV